MTKHGRLIDADALEKDGWTMHRNRMVDEKTMVYEVKKPTDFPTIEPERETGEWIPQDHNKKAGCVATAVYYYPKCSKCGHVGDYSMNFCGNCGARMSGGEQVCN